MLENKNKCSLYSLLLAFKNKAINIEKMICEKKRINNKVEELVAVI